LPWEPLTPFAEVLKNLPGRQNGAVADEEEDDDELEAYEDSLQRLRVSLRCSHPKLTRTLRHWDLVRKRIQ